MRLFFTFMALVLVGCGGSEASSVEGPVPDGGLATDGSAGPGPGGDGGVVTPTGDGGGDGGGGDGGAPDMRIDPIEVGHAWTYNVQVLGYYPACSNGVFTSNTLQSTSLDGKTALHVQSLCKDAGIYKYAVEGDRVWVHFGGSWKLSLDAPVAEGHTWSDGLRDYRWDKKGSVTTPAGTFADCWSATTVAAYTSYILLCRGVGPVKWHYEDGFGNGYEAILTAKNF